MVKLLSLPKTLTAHLTANNSNAGVFKHPNGYDSGSFLLFRRVSLPLKHFFGIFY